jgi:hypothetical protein
VRAYRRWPTVAFGRRDSHPPGCAQAAAAVGRHRGSRRPSAQREVRGGVARRGVLRDGGDHRRGPAPRPASRLQSSSPATANLSAPTACGRRGHAPAARPTAAITFLRWWARVSGAASVATTCRGSAMSRPFRASAAAGARLLSGAVWGAPRASRLEGPRPPHGPRPERPSRLPGGRCHQPRRPCFCGLSGISSASARPIGEPATARWGLQRLGLRRLFRDRSE